MKIKNILQKKLKMMTKIRKIRKKSNNVIYENSEIKKKKNKKKKLLNIKVLI